MSSATSWYPYPTLTRREPCAAPVHCIERDSCAAQRQCTERIVAKYGTDWCTYIYMHIYTYILHCSQKILESYDMMPELSQRRPAATTTIATDEAGDQAAEDREDEDKACLQGTNQIELSYLTVCVRLSGKVSSIWEERVSTTAETTLAIWHHAGPNVPTRKSFLQAAALLLLQQLYTLGVPLAQSVHVVLYGVPMGFPGGRTTRVTPHTFHMVSKGFPSRVARGSAKGL